MKRMFSLTLGAALLSAASLCALPARAEGLYVGGSLGVPQFGSGGVNGIGGSNSGASGKLFAGYQLSPNFAVEGGLADLGRLNGGAAGSVKAHGEYLDAVGLVPLSSDWSLLGSLGVSHVNLDTTAGDDSGVGLKVGLGAEYAITRSLSLRGEWEHYSPSAFGGHPGIGQYTLGVSFGF